MSTNQSAVEVQPHLFFDDRCERNGRIFRQSDGRAGRYRWCDSKTRPSRSEDCRLPMRMPDDAEAQRVFDALTESGNIKKSLMRFSAKFGMLEDKFGVGWMV